MLVFKIALKDLWRRRVLMLQFLALMSLGLSALTLVFVYKDSVQFKVINSSQKSMGSDLQISTRGAFDKSDVELLTEWASNNDLKSAKVLTTLTQVTSQYEGMFRTVWMQPPYPFYADLKTQKGATSFTEFFKKVTSAQLVYPITWVESDLADQLQVTIGDLVTIGKTQFMIDDIIIDSSFIGQGFSRIFPSLYFAYDDLEQTKLIARGSTHFMQWHYLLSGSSLTSDRAKKQLSSLITNSALRIQTPRDNEEQAQKIFVILGDYLGIVSLVALGLALIGLIYLYHGHVYCQLTIWGVFKVLGFSPWQIARFFFTQTFILNLLVSVWLYPVLSILLYFAVKTTLFQNLGFVEFSFLSLNVSILKVLFISTLGGLLCLAPLLFPVIHAKPYLLMQNKALSFVKSLRSHVWLWPSIPVYMFVSAFLLTQSHKISIFFTIGVIGFILLTMTLCLACIWLSHKFVSRLKKLSWPNGVFFLLALKTVLRNQTLSVTFIVSLAFSLCFSWGFMLMNHGFLEVLNSDKIKSGPSHFLFSLEEHQVSSLKSDWAEKFEVEILNLSPILTGKLITINGKKVVDIISEQLSAENDRIQTREEQEQLQFRNRAMNFSYRSYLLPSERVVKGKFTEKFNPKDDFWETAFQPFDEIWDDHENYRKWAAEHVIPVSLERRYAQRLGVKLGDFVDVYFQGAILPLVITSLREIDWLSFYPNFFVLFPAGVLEDAPQSYLGALKISESTSIAAMQGLKSLFPNAAGVHLRHTITKVLELLSSLQSALTILAFFVLCVAVFMLALIVLQKTQNSRRDINLLHYLGLSPSQIAIKIWLESLIMLVIGIVLGSFAGVALAKYVVENYLFAEFCGVKLSDIFIFVLFGMGLVLLFYCFARWATQAVSEGTSIGGGYGRSRQ